MLHCVAALLHEGRIPDLRCKCEVGVRQKRELTFTLPKNSVSFCTAARRLGAQTGPVDFSLRVLAREYRCGS